MTPTHAGTDMDFQPTGLSGQTNPLPKLKPCPFCGADNVNLSIEYDDWGDMYIYCAVCDSIYQNCCDDKTIEGWNRRAKE